MFVPVGTTAHATHTIYRVHNDDDGDGDAKVPRNLPTVWIKTVTPACAWNKVVDIKYSESRSQASFVVD